MKCDRPTPKDEYDKTNTSHYLRSVLKIEIRKATRSTLKGKVYNFLERPKGWRCFIYHLTLFLMVLVCLSFSVLTTIDTYSKFAHEVLFWMEIVIVITFAGEYMIRLWSAGCRSKYMGLSGRFRYMGKPMSLIDLVVVLASILVLTIGSNGQMFATSAIRGIRFIQILRMLHVDRQGGTWQLLGSVIFHHRQELLTTLYIGFLGLIFSSYFVYLAEKDADGDDSGNSDFASYADALWWGVATFTTIGYGDKVPKTWVGRGITAFFSLLIISFITLPSGIIGSGFALRVQQKQRQKHFSRQFRAAATLIQNAWRWHALENRHSATWRIHARRYNDWTTNTAANRKKAPNSLTRRRPKEGDRNPVNDVPNELHGQVVPSNKRNTYDNQAFATDVSLELDEMSVSGNEICVGPGQTEPVKMLGSEYMNAIRWIRKTKFAMAIRRFKQSRKPYDVGDILEQYSEGHSEMMLRIKELHRRMDQVLGKPLSQLKTFHDSHGPKPMTMQTRLCHIEQQLHLMEANIDNQTSMLEEIATRLGHQKRRRHSETIALHRQPRKPSFAKQIVNSERL